MYPHEKWNEPVSGSPERKPVVFLVIPVLIPAARKSKGACGDIVGRALAKKPERQKFGRLVPCSHV